MSKIFIEHYVAEAWGVDPTLLNSKTKLLQASLRSAECLKLTVVKPFIHKFKPYGLSLVLVISESHLAIHTWPEFGYLHVDVLSCSKKTNLRNLEKILKEEFKPSKITHQKVSY